jgi:hypothetical protein
MSHWRPPKVVCFCRGTMYLKAVPSSFGKDLEVQVVVGKHLLSLSSTGTPFPPGTWSCQKCGSGSDYYWCRGDDLKKGQPPNARLPGKLCSVRSPSPVK